ncbi:ATP-binding protein [Pseudoduganella buxea]|uniref:histidine kinase n=1 Tax=Pseudoduganella buxea TaxID=1949069 RepID=A0A6I3T7I9_9BURK|nr:ATP-binding protein [Pseudoduganella buxea]MTV55527.1 sensor histidine kinase [Pseudoduganella buxea]GGB99699.1 two-component sensor histidine kinase [Pseudoduganella buxea]
MTRNTDDPERRLGSHQQVRVAAAGVEYTAGHKNMMQLIQLRWFAVIGQLTTIAGANLVYDIRLPLVPMLQVLACLIAFNVASHLRWHEVRYVRNTELFMALLVDVAILTSQLYLSGGATNPFAFLFLLQVILSAVLLRPAYAWTFVLITASCLAGLSRHYLPLPLALDHERGIESLYVQGLLICFMLNAALLVFFITRITANLRAGDAQLANLRQRAAEEEHVVRMGLLASGAAHELGTPLATLSVILGDWKRMPEFSRNPELLEEIGEMQVQLKRCKAIVSGILLSAGEARGESSVKTTIRTFLDELAREWQGSRPVVAFAYHNAIGADLPVVFDETLKQMVCNVLDNALEASPDWVGMDAMREDGHLILRVTDRGPGFDPAVLAQLGKPYNSTKGRPGSGLGLFLVVNVARTLGGTVAARNRDDGNEPGKGGGGAAVTIRLPLSAIALDKNALNERG